MSGSIAFANGTLRQVGAALASGVALKEGLGQTRGSGSTPTSLVNLDALGDGFELPPRVRTSELPTVDGSSPLKALGRFKGFVQTPKGDVFVTIHPGTEASKKEPPLVYVGGLATWGDRVDNVVSELGKSTGRTAIGIVLPGQAETLDRDVNRTGGESLKNGITDKDQAETVVQVLDTLGVPGKVDMAGLSYGGAVVAAMKRDQPERVGQAMLIAPHVRSAARFNGGEALWQLQNSNPLGRLSYRAGTQALLNTVFGLFSTSREHPVQFLKGVGALTAGVDRLELDQTVAGKPNVHVLVAENDPISPPSFNRQAVEAAGPGSTFTLAPKELKGKHDLIDAGLPQVARWVSGVLKASKAGPSAAASRARG